MLVVSDVHGATGALHRLTATGETLVILGDLVNLTDYRNGAGAIADALGIDFARASAAARADGDYTEMRALWTARVGDRMDEVRESISESLQQQYSDVGEALHGGHGYVIHGNVDRPDRLMACLPDGFSYVHGRTVEVEGMSLGFAGGGVTTPIRADGEVTDQEMSALLEGLGAVDILCTHVPPAVAPLRRDVITGREERGSGPIRDYVMESRPRLHLYGDVHQAQAATWRLGPTRCYNAGYFRATGRYLRVDGSTVRPTRLR